MNDIAKKLHIRRENLKEKNFKARFGFELPKKQAVGGFDHDWKIYPDFITSMGRWRAKN